MILCILNGMNIFQSEDDSKKTTAKRTAKYKGMQVVWQNLDLEN